MEMEKAGSPTEQFIPMPSQPQPQPQMQPQAQAQSQPQPSTSFTIFVWKFFSVISWVFLIITSFEGYRHGSLFFSMNRDLNNLIGVFVPISMDIGMFQSFFLIILLFAFYHFAYLGLYKGDNTIVDPFFDNMSKYHFIPFLLVSIMNLNAFAADGEYDEIKKFQGEIITNFIFTIISLGCLGYIYYKMVFNHEWYIVLTMKKGIFSALIIILWYNFAYSIVLLGIINSKTPVSFLKGSGIAFSIIIGVFSLVFSYAFKDLIAEYTAALKAAPQSSDDKEVKTKAYWQAQIDWLKERFPNGTYTDVIGLCKAASIEGEDGIRDQDYSLNAGRYVGVVIEDDGMTEAEFKAKMLGLNTELETLSKEAGTLEARIAANLKELFN